MSEEVIWTAVPNCDYGWWLQDYAGVPGLIHVVLIFRQEERFFRCWNGHSFDAPIAIPEGLSLEEAKALAFTTWSLTR